MAPARDVTVGIYHGDGCTCQRLEPIKFEPVIVSEDCPGRMEPTSLAQAPRQTEIPSEVVGIITIDWSSSGKPGHLVRRSSGTPGHYFSDRVSITNTETNQPILTVTELHVHAVVGHTVVAELLTLADADGNPILDGAPTEINGRMAVADDGTFATATSWWHVGEMRVGA